MLCPKLSSHELLFLVGEVSPLVLHSLFALIGQFPDFRKACDANCMNLLISQQNVVRLTMFVYHNDFVIGYRMLFLNVWF